MSNNIFDELMYGLAKEAKDKEELIRIWINIGLKLGIDEIFPHLKVIVHKEEEDNELEEGEIVALIGSYSDYLVEELSSDEVLTPELIDEVLNRIENHRRVIH